MPPAPNAGRSTTPPTVVTATSMPRSPLSSPPDPSVSRSEKLLRWWGRTRPVGLPLLAEPGNGSVLLSSYAPAVLVDEPVMERADEHQVLEVRSPTLFPPNDVMGLRESFGAAGREAALAVPVLQVPNHPRRGLPGHATEADREAAVVLDHGLPPRVARQPASGVGIDRGPVFDLALAELAVGPVHPRVHDHRRPVGFFLGPAADRAQRNQRISPPRFGAGRPLLVRPDRQVPGKAVERLGHDRALRRRELALHPEPPSLVERPPGEGATPLHIDEILSGAARGDVGFATDRSTRDAARPDQQARLGFGRGEARQLDGLVQVQFTGSDRVRDARQGLERVGGGDPPLCLPI